MNKSHAIQNNLKADYCPQLLHANAMFHLTDEALSSNLLTRNAKMENYLGLFSWSQMAFIHMPPDSGFAIGSPSALRILAQATKSKPLGYRTFIKISLISLLLYTICRSQSGHKMIATSGNIPSWQSDSCSILQKIILPARFARERDDSDPLRSSCAISTQYSWIERSLFPQ